MNASEPPSILATPIGHSVLSDVGSRSASRLVESRQGGRGRSILRRQAARGLTASGDLRGRVGVGSVEVGDEVGGSFHASISRLTEVPCRGDVARFGGDAGKCVEGEDFDVGVVVAPGVVEDGDETFLGAGFPVRCVHGGEEASAEGGLFASFSGAMPRGRRFERRARFRDLSECPQDAPEVNPGERRQPYITGGLGLVDRPLQGGGTGVVVTGLALRSSEAGQLVCLGLPEAETLRCFRGASEVGDGIVEPVLDAGQLTENRVTANVQPRVVDGSQPVLHVIDSVDAALLVVG